MTDTVRSAAATALEPAPPLGRQLGAGGEAEVYEVRDGSREAYKRYRRPTTERASKLRVMVAHPPAQAEEVGGHIAIAWPRALVSSDGRTVDGFRMTRVDLARAVPLFQVYNPQSRARIAPGFTWRYLMRTARNVAAIVASLHDAGYVIGDLNESNFLVTDRALVVLVDCDSMQVRDPETGVVHRGAFGKPEFLAPELQGVDLGRTDRTVESDRFSLGVLIFLLLMEGLHPFAGVWRGRGEPPDLPVRMRRRMFPYRRATRLGPPPLGVPLRALPYSLRGLLRRALCSGARRGGRRPAARAWVDALERAEGRLRRCRRSEHHLYGRAALRCPWCARVDAGLPDPFPGLDGSAVAPRSASRVRKWARQWARRYGKKVWPRWRPHVVAATTMTAVTWIVPLAGVVLVAALPSMMGARTTRRDAPLSWWRWRSLLVAARAARSAVAASARRLHWTAAGATVGAAAAVFLLAAGPWTAGRVAIAAAALTHTLANLRQ